MGFHGSAWLAGFLLGGGLIVAIGAQNAYVIRQGVIGQHTFAVCLFCALSDATLIVAGVLGLGALLDSAPFLLPALTYGGAAFLVWYGVKALRRAWQPLGYAAHPMRNWLSRPKVWRALDLLIAAVMFFIAFKLLSSPPRLAA